MPETSGSPCSPVSSIGFDVVFAVAGVDRFRPRLKNEQLAGDAVLRPFDVHRRRLAGKRSNNALRSAQAHARAAALHNRSRQKRLRCASTTSRVRVPRAVESVNHLYFFAAETAADDRPSAGLQSRFENDPLIRRRHSLHDRFAESPGAVDHDHIAKT